EEERRAIFRGAIARDGDQSARVTVRNGVLGFPVEHVGFARAGEVYFAGGEVGRDRLTLRVAIESETRIEKFRMGRILGPEQIERRDYLGRVPDRGGPELGAPRGKG